MSLASSLSMTMCSPQAHGPRRVAYLINYKLGRNPGWPGAYLRWSTDYGTISVKFKKVPPEIDVS